MRSPRFTADVNNSSRKALLRSQGVITAFSLMRPLKKTINTQSIRRESKEHHLQLFPWTESSTHGPVLATHSYSKVMNQSRFGVPLGLRLEGRSGSSGDGSGERSIWNVAPAADSLPCLHLLLKTDRTTLEGTEIRGESVGVNSGTQCYCESSVPHTCASRLHFRLVHALLETLQTCALPTA